MKSEYEKKCIKNYSSYFLQKLRNSIISLSMFALKRILPIGLTKVDLVNMGIVMIIRLTFNPALFSAAFH